ncbi:hypothetical protein KY290_023088 [Solanum tuberosum]|uniref:Uncharacterized protein n=1 Tax=Solanum tuberosum TaxID=4113 RepID=A0ABQ7V9B8_SOLTU|nr:hypothetical protein KY284_022013 [Solanum tuberosum]KAH0684361.1 hypothetical protein KY289_022113 [Solanum tuberosum]KAH0694785.1 hypothetical protein KY285_021882 [Solanum tuberosum]KAH0759595.1 hypothetical protein KY290_023088 [Solanum tuberosum]
MEIEKAEQDMLFKTILKEAATFHFWNGLTSAMVPEAGSLAHRLINYNCLLFTFSSSLIPFYISLSSKPTMVFAAGFTVPDGINSDDNVVNMLEGRLNVDESNFNSSGGYDDEFNFQASAVSGK